MLIADGVNWGEKSRLAARCALYGSMEYINRQLFAEKQQPANTQVKGVQWHYIWTALAILTKSQLKMVPSSIACELKHIIIESTLYL